MHLTLIGLVCSLLLSEDARPLPESASLDIVLQEVQGEVEVRLSEKEKWTAATKGLKVRPGAKLCTGVGSGAALAFGSNSVVLISECTILTIQAFEMRGDKLVASVHLDPGVAKVSVKQLAQFHTDFQVSTPRQTCSVKGSEGLFIVNGGPDDLPDLYRNVEGDVHVDDVPLAEGGATNSDGDSSHDLALSENLADTTPDGATHAETRDTNLLATNAGNIDLIPSDTTVNTGGGASGSDNLTNLEPPPQEFPGHPQPRSGGR